MSENTDYLFGGKRQNRMRGACRHAPREKGAALVLSLLTGVLMLGLALPFLFKLSGQYHVTDKSYKSMSALNLAEAGIERAIWELNHGDISTWSGSSSERTMPIADFTASSGAVIGNIAITVYNPGTANPSVESTGSVAHAGAQNVMKTLRIVLQGTSPNVFNFGLFGQTGVTIYNNALTDSYDSRLGAYGGSNIHHNGDVGTNATNNPCISLYNNGIIDGDAVSGYQSNPATAIYQGNNATISGQKSALDQAKEIPSVPAPTGLTFRGSYSLSGTDTISQSGQYSNFTLNNNAVVTITSDVTLYITGTFTLSNNSQFRISSGASAVIYFGGSMSISNNALINNQTQDPTKLVMYGTDTFTGSQTFRNNTNTYAAIYFPKANVTIYNNGNIYGSLVANSITLQNNVDFHYDEALASFQSGLGAPAAPFTMKSWQEKI